MVYGTCSFRLDSGRLRLLQQRTCTMRLSMLLLMAAGIVSLAGCARRPVAFTKMVRPPLPTTAADAGVDKKGEPQADNKPASVWIGKLKDNDEKVRGDAANDLVKLHDTAVPVLVLALKDTE